MGFVPASWHGRLAHVGGAERLRRLRLQIRDVDVAVGIAGDDHHTQTRELRARRVRAVR
jgi:hypothetical protein